MQYANISVAAEVLKSLLLVYIGDSMYRQLQILHPESIPIVFSNENFEDLPTKCEHFHWKTYENRDGSIPSVYFLRDRKIYKIYRREGQLLIAIDRFPVRIVCVIWIKTYLSFSPSNIRSQSHFTTFEHLHTIDGVNIRI